MNDVSQTSQSAQDVQVEEGIHQKIFIDPAGESLPDSQSCLSGNKSSSTSPCQVTVDTGEYFSCAIVAGQVKCWGDNRTGILGNNTVGGFVSVPQVVPGLSNVTAIATGNLHACAVSNGQVSCWGSNNSGQIGNGLATGNVLTPYTIPTLSNVIALAAGSNHTCALTSINSVSCWGWNKYGQLGTGSTTNALVPVNIPALAGSVAISAGTLNTCSIKGTQAMCWGWNQYGQVGTGSASPFVATPFPIPSLTNIKSIDTGNGHSCAVTSTGVAKCWGQNQYGQVGNNTTSTQLSPVQVTGLGAGAVILISTGDLHSCAVTAAGTAKCWGWNKYGQLGRGTYTGINSTAQNVLNITNVTSISAGFSHTCAVSETATNKTISCFGQGYNGALGNGAVINQNTPVLTLSASVANVTAISVGYVNACAIVAGNVKCWGENASGQIGNGTIGGMNYPPTLVTGISNAIGITSGASFNCAIIAGGQVKCWGGNASGQLGNGSTISSLVPVLVSGVSGATKISANMNHTCAIVSGGQVKCWGVGNYGQLGNGSTSNSSTPVVVTGLSNVIDIAVGQDHTCAALANGTAACWGFGGYGQLGTGVYIYTSSTPLIVNNLMGVLNITTSSTNSSCAIVAGGLSYCWGFNFSGQLGNGTTTGSSMNPLPLSTINLNNVTMISGGAEHFCAKESGGSMKCWGHNGYGQLGDGTTNSSSTPVTVLSISNPLAIEVGSYSSCAIVGCQVKCWGDNSSGQLGDGTMVNSSVPVSVQGL